MNAIYILCLRQLKRHFRARERMIGSLGQPLLFLFAIGFGFGPTWQKAGGGNYIQFLAPGVMLMGVLFVAIFTGVEVIWDRQFGFLRETLVAPVPRIQIVLGRTLGGALVSLLQGLIVFVVCLIAGFRVHDVALLPVALVFLFLAAIVFTALGTAIGSVLQDMQAFPLIMNFLIMPLFFFSGAIFPVHGLPPALAVVVRLDPLTYGVDGLRGALTGVSSFGLVPDFAVLTVLAAAVLALGSYLFSKIEV